MEPKRMTKYCNYAWLEPDIVLITYSIEVLLTPMDPEKKDANIFLNLTQIAVRDLQNGSAK